MLTPQHQQQLMLAQQNLTSPSASDDSRRLRMLLNNRSMGLGKDGLSNSVGDVVANVGSPLQAASMMPRGDTDMLIKVLFHFLFLVCFLSMCSCSGYAVDMFPICTSTRSQ